MAAGLGFKTFTTGEVLTAADVNGYLMQGVLVFASEAARDAAITSPQEGQFAYTKDNNSLWYYTGSAWAASGATGDIEGVTAGIGISGGGTSGTVTITNSMATTIDAAGDIIYGTGNDAFTKLSIGTAGQILKVNSGATAPEWGAAASGALTKISKTAFSGATSVSVNNCFTSTYTNYLIVVDNFNSGANGSEVYLQFQYSTNTVQATNYYSGAYYMQSNGTSGNYNRSNSTSITLGTFTDLARGLMSVYASGVGNSSQNALWNGTTNGANSSGSVMLGGHIDAAQTYTGIKISAANNISGNVTIYGLEK